MLVKIVIGCAFAGQMVAAGVGQRGDSYSSAYTSLNKPPCRLQSLQVEGANSQLSCPGVHGYRLLLLDSDGRMSVTVVSPRGSRHPLDFWETVTANFSSVGDRAEWRIRQRGSEAAPVAVIVPLKINDDPESSKATSYLVVARIDPGKVCAVGKFKDDADGRTQARSTADAAIELKCLTQ